MYTVRNLLLTIRLINSPLGVTKKTLCEELNVTERTIYRYINVLSEAGVPVYYDSKSGRYRHAIEQGGLSLGISTSDATIILYSLLILSQQLNKGYQQLIEEIISVLTTSLNNPGKSTWESIRELVEASNSNLPTSTELTSILTAVAIRTGASLKIFENSVEAAQEGLVLNTPSMQYHGNWSVLDQTDQSANSVTISDQTFAKIME